jgi:hypothetical protein
LLHQEQQQASDLDANSNVVKRQLRRLLSESASSVVSIAEVKHSSQPMDFRPTDIVHSRHIGDVGTRHAHAASAPITVGGQPMSARNKFRGAILSVMAAQRLQMGLAPATPQDRNPGPGSAVGSQPSPASNAQKMQHRHREPSPQTPVVHHAPAPSISTSTAAATAMPRVASFPSSAALPAPAASPATSRTHQHTHAVAGVVQPGHSARPQPGSSTVARYALHDNDIRVETPSGLSGFMSSFGLGQGGYPTDTGANVTIQSPSGLGFASLAKAAQAFTRKQSKGNEAAMRSAASPEPSSTTPSVPAPGVLPWAPSAAAGTGLLVPPAPAPSQATSRTATSAIGIASAAVGGTTSRTTAGPASARWNIVAAVQAANQQMAASQAQAQAQMPALHRVATAARLGLGLPGPYAATGHAPIPSLGAGSHSRPAAAGRGRTRTPPPNIKRGIKNS